MYINTVLRYDLSETMYFIKEEGGEPDGLYEFYNAIHRILMFFAAIYYKFFWQTNAETLRLVMPKTIANVEQEYSEKYLSRFLEFASQPYKNANVDAVFGDAEALVEILKDANNDVEKEWHRRVLIENTPRGNVYMFYDVYKRAFAYYCDQAVMPYRVINAVAMKYVMTFRCCDFFVDSSVLPKIEPDLVEATEKQKESTGTKNASKEAFAKFKTYNVASKKAEVAKKDEKTINGFLHLGKVRNWQIIEKPKRANPLNGFKTDMVPSNAKLSYNDYKKMANKGQC